MLYCKQIPYLKSNPIKLIKSLPTTIHNLVAITNGTLPPLLSHHQSNANLLNAIAQNKPTWLYGNSTDCFNQCLILNPKKQEKRTYLELGSELVSTLLGRKIENAYIANYHPDNKGMIEPLIQGTMLSNYSFGYKTNNNEDLSEINDLHLLIPKNESENRKCSYNTMDGRSSATTPI
jgi:hypothetical protein